MYDTGLDRFAHVLSAEMESFIASGGGRGLCILMKCEARTHIVLFFVVPLLWYRY
jgi:hypothetical protein